MFTVLKMHEIVQTGSQTLVSRRVVHGAKQSSVRRAELSAVHCAVQSVIQAARQCAVQSAVHR